MKMRNFLATALLCCGFAAAQPFVSGSDGSDGALSYTTPGTYTFDPVALHLNAAGDNIFNFTTITIASNVTLVLTNANLRGKPVVWLAQGNVNIAGTLSVDGQSGLTLSNYGADWITYRLPTQPGPGGFPGGVGARPGTPAYPGLGPGGSPVQTNANCGNGGGASFATVGYGTPVGPTYGNIQTVPLVGGSGGSGGCVPANPAADAAGGSGGAGGGAIRIVSTTQISVTGRISANGGGAGYGRNGGTAGGNGSGGTINLIAPIVTGNGQLYAAGGGGSSYGGGYILLNATTNTFNGSVPYGIETLRPLLAPPLPTATSVPTVTITSVNGVSVPQPPQGAFQTPDVTINAANAVTINISAANVPTGTVVKLSIQSELTGDQNISCTPLAGTLAASTATCSAAFPTSVSHILASASW